MLSDATCFAWQNDRLEENKGTEDKRKGNMDESLSVTSSVVVVLN